MNYAIVQTGGKQILAEKGKQLDIEKLELKDGATVKLDKVLLVSNEGKIIVGRPYVKGAYVEAEIVKTYRDKKVISFKYIRREGGAKTKIGHRQSLTRILVKSVVV
jgi:large subunit ribosomal protein L21